MERIDILKANEHKFWAYVNKIGYNDCWDWIKYKDELGYGQFQFSYLGKKFNYRANRVAFELSNFQIPDGLVICHKCDNPKCVNPNHLFMGTHKDNSDDKVNKNRHAKAETSGRSKLNWKIVNEIRKIYPINKNTSEISKKYNIDSSTIMNILKGKSWVDENYIPIQIGKNFKKGHTYSMTISAEKVIEIKKLINVGLSPKKISEITGVKNQKIRDIKRGVAYFNIKL